MPNNPRQFQTMYLEPEYRRTRTSKQPPGVIYPFWDQVNERGVGDLARYMGPNPGAATWGRPRGKLTWSAVPAGATQYLAVAIISERPH